MTAGIVSADGRELLGGNYNDFIQIDAPINQGNSGGPLVDACGRLVAVNTYISVDQQQSSKINYAIQAKSMVSFLSTAGVTPTVDHRTCGKQP